MDRSNGSHNWNNNLVGWSYRLAFGWMVSALACQPVLARQVPVRGAILPLFADPIDLPNVPAPPVYSWTDVAPTGSVPLYASTRDWTPVELTQRFKSVLGKLDPQRDFAVGLSKPIKGAALVHVALGPSGRNLFDSAGPALARMVDGKAIIDTRINVADNHPVRLRFSNLRVPPGTRIFLSTAAGPVRELLVDSGGDHSSLWSPTMPAGDIAVHLEVPLKDGESASFRISDTISLDVSGLERSASRIRGGSSLALADRYGNDAPCMSDGNTVRHRIPDLVHRFQKATGLLGTIVGVPGGRAP